MLKRPLTIAWFSFFPVEWLPDLPAPLRNLPKLHPASWQRVLLNELEKIADLRLHVLAIRKQFPRNLAFERHGVAFHCLKAPARLRAPSLFWLDTFLIHRTLKRVQPDLIHAWGTENGAALVASRLKYPCLVTMQGIMTWLREILPLNRYQRFMAALEERALRRLKTVTAESTFAVEHLKQRFPHLDVTQIEHAPDWIFHDVDRRPQVNPLRIICISSLCYEKGSDILFQALERLKGELAFELIFVGRAATRDAQRLICSLSAELRSRITFKENLSSREVADELATATLMIYPTRADNSPNAVKEAVVAGVPVIASDIGGIPDCVIPEQNGILFAPADITACLDAVRTACRHPVLGKGQVDAATLGRMRARLSPERMAQHFLEIYQNVVQPCRRQQQPA